MMNNDELVLVKINQNKIFNTLFQPLKNCVRIKYTCLAINSKYLICGASSGGLYIFKRLEDDLKFLLTIPGNVGKVTTIVFSENNSNLFAFGTNRGIFKLILLSFSQEKNITEFSNNQQYEEIYSTKSFTKFSITLIKFQEDDLNEFKLFIADDGFNVYLVNKLKTFSSILFKNEIPIKILKLDSNIHQIEIEDFNLLVSTEEKSLILNMLDLSLNQIGTKTRVNGIYGSCFIKDNDESKYIFSSRPSLRLWKVNLNGNVICTHQFKNYFNKNIPNYVYSLKDKNENNNISIEKYNSSLQFKNQNSNFNLLHCFRFNDFNYLITYTNVPESILFIINPLNAQIIFWRKFDEDIKNVLYTKDEIIVLHDFESKADQLNIKSQNLFTILKVYDLSFFKTNFNFLKNFTKSSLFNFMKNNKNLVIELFENDNDNDFYNYLKEEWLTIIKNKNKIYSNNLIITLDDNENHELSSLTFFFFENDLDEDFKIVQENEIYDEDYIDNQEIKKIDKNNKNNLNLKEETLNLNSNLVQQNNLIDNQNNLKSTDFIKIKHENISKLTSKNRWNKDSERNLKLRLGILINEEKKNLLKKKCSCGYPFPRSHLLFNNNQIEMKKILIKLLNDENLDEIKFKCFENAIWDLYLDLLIVNKQFEDYIITSVLLMDINLFYNDIFIQIFKTNIHLSEKLFDYILKQKNFMSNNRTICLICDKNYQVDYLKWNEILNFLYKTLDIEKLIDLLMKNNTYLPNTVLSSQFCLNLLQTETIRQYESSLTNEKLLKLNDHFKIKKFNNNKNVDSKLSWSIYLNLKNKKCDICKVSLKDYKKPLLVFKCNHVYHKKCDDTNVNLRKCYLCTQIN